MAEKGDPRTGRGRIKERRRRVRVALCDHGLKLMARRGMAACKVEDVTRAAGVAKGTFFNHFSSKNDFIVQLVKRMLEDLARRVRPVGLMPTDAESLLAAVGGVHLRYFQLRPDSASLLTQAQALPPETPEGAEINGLISQHLEMLSGMLSPACAKLDWPVDHARELALCMLATSAGFFWFGRAVGAGSDTPTDLLDRLGRILARGLKAEEQ